MKYLITGITGFAGPHLANLLIANGHEVYGLIRGSNGMETDILDVVPEDNFAKIKFLYGDLVSSRSMNQVFRDNKFDGVFHLAAQSHPPTSFTDMPGTFETNVQGSVNLIQAIIDNQPESKLMFCSTSEVYGDTGNANNLLKVDGKLLPANPYGASKVAIDLLLQERIASGKIKAFITRAFSHTGPRRGKNFSISSDAYQIAKMSLGLQGLNLKIGNLNTIRTVIDVRDCVNAYYLAMLNENCNGKIFNVCGKTPMAMKVYTDILIEEAKLTNKVNLVIEPAFWREIDINYQLGDSEEIRLLTGWNEEYSIQATMHDLYNYWIKKINMIRTK